jgi:NitT/TauT family transport system substrate-binding protein
MRRKASRSSSSRWRTAMRLTPACSTGLSHFDPQDPYVCLFALEESFGGDGIVADRAIRSIADLEGKVVAFPRGTVSQFYLNVLLKEAGLGDGDIEAVDLGADDAGSAFLLGEVDAAVTWEPWLTEVRNSDHGHVLADSSRTPGLLIDCLVTRRVLLESHREEIGPLERAWDAAVGYVEAQPDEAHRIMAHHVGGWLEDPAVFAEAVSGARFYNLRRNREYSGTPERPGQIYETAQYGTDV